MKPMFAPAREPITLLSNQPAPTPPPSASSTNSECAPRAETLFGNRLPTDDSAKSKLRELEFKLAQTLDTQKAHSLEKDREIAALRTRVKGLESDIIVMSSRKQELEVAVVDLHGSVEEKHVLEMKIAELKKAADGLSRDLVQKDTYSKREIQKLEETFERQSLVKEREHQASIIDSKRAASTDMQTRAVEHELELENLLQKKAQELQSIKKSILDQAHVDFEMERESIQVLNEKAAQKLVIDHSTEIQKLEREAQHLQEDFKHQLYQSEQAQLRIKKQIFEDREKNQEVVDGLEKHILKLTQHQESEHLDFETQKRALQEETRKALMDLKRREEEGYESEQLLVAKEREMFEILDEHAHVVSGLEIKLADAIQANTSFVEEGKQKDKSWQISQSELSESLSQMKNQVSECEAKVAFEKKRAQDAVEKSQDVQAETGDQLSRVQYLLEMQTRESQQYRERATELDNQVLDLKRKLRQKEKEISGGLITSDSSALKRLIEQKDKEIDSARSETRQALSDQLEVNRKLSVLQARLDEQTFHLQRRDVIKGSGEDVLAEVDRLQFIIVDMKICKVELLEKVDNFEHELTVAYDKIEKLNAKLTEI